MKITEEGEFLRWDHYKKTYEGMASPLAQNDRHVAVLRDAFDRIEMPTRLGLRLSPTFHPFVLVSANARVDRPRKFDSSKIIKVDALRNTINTQVEKVGVLNVLGSMARLVSVETLQEIGKQLIALHKPAAFDIAARFGMTDPELLQSELRRKTLRAVPRLQRTVNARKRPAGAVGVARSPFSTGSMATTSSVQTATGTRRSDLGVAMQVTESDCAKTHVASIASAPSARAVRCTLPIHNEML